MSHPPSIRIVQPHTSLPLAGAIIHGDTIYVSGQVGFKPGTADLAGSDLARQARQTMANVDAVLAAAGSDRSRILKVGIYLKNVERDFAEMNRYYSEWLGAHKPARTTVRADMAFPEILVEIDCVAATGAEAPRP